MKFDVNGVGSKMRVERGDYGYRVVIDWADNTTDMFYNTKWVSVDADTLIVIY